MAEKGAGKLQRLAKAVEYHYEQLGVLRKSRDAFIAAAAGSMYPHRKDAQREVLNVMGQAGQAHALSMAANRPRITAVSETVERQQFADHYRRAINKYSAKMHLEEVLQECAYNSFFLQGVCKVYMSESAAVFLEADEWMDPGQPFAQSISPNHLCYDTDATDFRHCSFIADRYRVRYEDLLVDDRFPEEVRAKIAESGPQSLQAANQEESLNPLGNNGFSQFEEFVYLCDVFLPKDGVVYTFACDERFRFTVEEPLAEVAWEGSETGPYFFLNLGPVPDQITPSSPAANLILCHNMINSLYRKLEDQAEAQKQLKVAQEGSELAERARDAVNGEWIVGNAQDVEEVRFDGPDQNLFGFLLNAQQQFSQLGGNLHHKLGTAATADTATQQGMIGQSVSRAEAHQQERFVAFVRKVVRELGRLLFNDQTTRIPMAMEVPGTDYQVDDPWRGGIEEGSRQGEFEDYDLDIVPESMPYRSSQQRLQELDARMNKYIQLQPLLVQQGKTLNFNAMLKSDAEYSNLPELERMIVDLPPQPGQEQQGPGGSHERTLPDPNKGQYTHHSTGGAGGADPNAEAMQLMAAGQQGG